ncbi:helix-turn-helix transcriptional regulator [Ideonella azotifigens]|uniref:Substrate-binding domain-containing protein n=1 Tax=Ideonella azotifigens TaxID=513160 RepID=A0ABP3VCR5_9BURK|nr:substrate-binding domain-containing protein [Ideonella azotifigens]MCD2342379.1 helix-turn-helix transcriptional regulator [Ideonella azotifigens]
MDKISIHPVWTIQTTDGGALPPRLLTLLVQVHAHGSLLAACQQMGLSYRHAWDLVHQGEAQLGATLLHMTRGKGSKLSALGEKLVWADHRIAARLKPALDSLASELAAEIGRLAVHTPPMLRLHASHGFAIEALVSALSQDGLAVERRYGSSTEAVAALCDHACDAAGFHVPLGPLATATLAHYARWLAEPALCVIDIATRRQGLMVACGNPAKVYELSDLLRPGLRFINRQAGSGTRFLLERLLAAQGLDAGRISGFEQGEFTHAAVAAYVASGMADVGFGLEPPARRFGLDFMPQANERYFLLCHAQTLERPAMQQLLARLRDPAMRAQLDALPGYDARHAGRVTPLVEAFQEPAALG